uniref:Protein max n=1 Tax=Anas platyrhynchos TaxID=8839 RepID=A0A8B9R4Y2_ANAPL
RAGPCHGETESSCRDKRAHHNALERKRRDHIKDSFHSLRDSVPSLQGEKASRAQILDKATEYIQYMRRKNHTHQQDIDDLKRQNALLEQQGEEKAPETGPGGCPTHPPAPPQAMPAPTRRFSGTPRTTSWWRLPLPKCWAMASPLRQ